MKIQFSLLVLELMACLPPSSGTVAQQRISPLAGRPNPLGFSYGWSGGITVEQDGTVKMSKHPRVQALRPGTGVAASGLAAGDVIVSVDGRDARDPAALHDIPAGIRTVLVVRRGRAERRIALHAGPRDDG